jgi:hypothetical protein
MNAWRRYRWTLIAGLAALLFAAPIHGGFLIYLVIPVLAIWIMYNLVRARKDKARLKPLGAKLLIWLAVIAIVLGRHGYLFKASHADADLALSKVLAYRTQHGVYPADLAAAGIGDPHFGQEWALHYEAPNGQPELLYFATFVPFDTYSYDFQTMEWRYQVD